MAASLRSWLAAHRTTQTGAETAKKDPQEDEATKQAKKASWRRTRRVLDLVGFLWWTYVVLQVLGFDPLRWALESIDPSLDWIADYRYLFFLVVVPLLCAIFWQLKTLGLILYIVLFPLIVLLWKFPKLVFKSSDWSVAMAVFNGVGLAVRNLRYGLFTKSLGFLAVFVILFVRAAGPLVVAGVTVLCLLMWATVRTVRRTFERNWFLTTQLQAIDSITEAKPVHQMLSIEQHTTLPLPQHLEPHVANQMATAISLSIVVNKGLYFWAYQLKKYRQTRLGVIFDVASYVWLFMGAALAFGLANAALYVASPAQYQVPDGVSAIGVFAYGVSTLAFGNIAGVSAVGDYAGVLAIFGGMFGVCVLAILAIDLLLTVRRERDDAALYETVDALKDRARAQDERLRKETSVGVDEAWRRMEAIGFGFSWFVGYVVKTLPDDFEE